MRVLKYRKRLSRVRQKFSLTSRLVSDLLANKNDLLANKNDLLANKNDLLANKNDLLANKSLMRDLGCEGKFRIFKSKFIYSACIQFMMKGIRLFIYFGRFFSTYETEDGPVGFNNQFCCYFIILYTSNIYL
jgi:hypothetical protein